MISIGPTLNDFLQGKDNAVHKPHTFYAYTCAQGRVAAWTAIVAFFV